MIEPDSNTRIIPRGIIRTLKYWTIVLNENQTLLGRCYITLNRSETDFLAITAEEQLELFAGLSMVRASLDDLFQPDHYNYVALMNIVPHVHAHILPRYKTVRNFAGIKFHDPEFGGHYNPNAEQILSPEDFDSLAKLIADHLPGVSS